ncbi:MAG: FtsQ-type POTRA domain-containing protein [Mycoplasmatota bacterium]
MNKNITDKTNKKLTNKKKVIAKTSQKKQVNKNKKNINVKKPQKKQVNKSKKNINVKTSQKKQVNKSTKNINVKKPQKKQVNKNININKSQKKEKKKIRIKYKNVLIFIILLILFTLIFNYLINIPIKNIYIKGNSMLSDQEIIELAQLEDYPSYFKTFSYTIETILRNDNFIKEVKVTKEFFKIYIEVEENYPLFYYYPDAKTYLLNGETIDEELTTIYLINSVPSEYLNELLSNLQIIDKEILDRVSEIQYTPSVDLERFLFKMVDGNYVYINFNNFNSLNDYFEIIKYIEGKKGILNLDAGNSFEIFEE